MNTAGRQAARALRFQGVAGRQSGKTASPRTPCPALAPDAFTLVELLVVITVVAVLSAILLPTFAGVRRKAAQAQSVAQLQQLGVAANLYANENNGLLPLGYFYDPKQPGTGESSFAIQLAPYLQGTNAIANIFVSPTSVIKPVKPSRDGFVGLTYSANNLVCPDTSTGLPQVRRAQIASPSQVILFADGSQSPTTTYSRATFTNPPVAQGAQPDLDQPIPVGPDQDNTDGAGWLRYRGSGGTVAAVMVDGHAESLAKGTVLYRHIVPH